MSHWYYYIPYWLFPIPYWLSPILCYLLDIPYSLAYMYVYIYIYMLPIFLCAPQGMDDLFYYWRRRKIEEVDGIYHYWCTFT